MQGWGDVRPAPPRWRAAVAIAARLALIALLLLLAAWAVAAWQVRGVRELTEPERLSEGLAIIRAGLRAACVLWLVAVAGVWAALARRA